MRRYLTTSMVCFVLALWGFGLQAAEYDVYEDGSGDFETIQDAIDAAVEGDTIVVHPGTYYENIDFDGKNITLRSEDPEDESVVASTILDGGSAGSVVTLSGAEDETCELSGFTITNGSAQYGGGVFGGSSSDVSIICCTIVGNVAEDNGGGIYGCNGRIAYCTITGNLAANGSGLHSCDGTIIQCEVTDNAASGNGGGMYACDGDLVNSNVERNSAGYRGGGVYSCDACIRRCSIIDNSAENAGGGLAYCGGTLSTCAIFDNTAVSDGGGFFSCGAAIQDSTISGNSSEDDGGGLAYCGGHITGCNIYSNSAQRYGGGLYDCNGEIAYSTIATNSAVSQGGGILDCSGTIYACTIIDNFAGGWGGGLRNCDGEVGFCTISNNRANSHGGGLVYCPGDIHDCTITGNSAGIYGGGLYECNGTISTCEISDNTSDSDGGGLYRCDGLIQDCVIRNNSSSAIGGGLFECHATILRCVISGNAAETQGGGLASCDGPMSGCVIADNAANTGSGGGLRNCDGAISCCTISGNSAAVYGGGLDTCRGDVVSCIISGNVASGGGGLNSADGRLEGCTVSGNSSSGNGGGLLTCSAALYNCVIESNSSGNRGGGMYNCEGTVSSCIIRGNTAVTHGGGAMACSGDFFNCLIVDNVAEDSGGGLYTCSGTISTCTIAENAAITSSGGGILGCEGVVSDCIIWGNTASSGPQVHLGSTPRYCCIQDWSGGGECNKDEDPLFETGPHGYYYLSSKAAGQPWDSPCINAGSGPAADLGVDILTTRTDGVTDSHEVDMGYHFSPDMVAPESECLSPEFAKPPFITVSYEASDADGSGLLWVELWYKYEYDSDTWATAGLICCGEAGSFAFRPEYGEGIYHFQTVARDIAGNVEEIPTGDGDTSTLYDATVPSSSCTSPACLNSTIFSVLFTATEEGGSGISSVALWYKFGECGSWTDTGQTKTGLSGGFALDVSDGDGTYYFQTIAQDNAGNVERGPVGSGDTYTLVDTIPPESSCTSAAYSSSTSIPVTFSASDGSGSGVMSVDLWYKFGEAGTWTDSGLQSSKATDQFNFTASDGQGTYYFQAKASDLAGNGGPDPSGDGDCSTVLDLTDPESSCESPELANLATISVQFIASDAGGSGLASVALWYKFGESGIWASTGLTEDASSGQFNFAPQGGEGTYYFQTVACDQAGNTEAAPSGNGEDSTLYDTTAPSSNCDCASHANSQPIAVTYIAADAGSGVGLVALWYNHDGGGWADSGLSETGVTGSFDFVPGDGDGTYQFYTIACDSAGNVETAPTEADDSAVYDTVAPESSCTSPTYANTSPIGVDFTATDALSGVTTVALWYNFDGEGWTDSELFETAGSGSFDFIPSDGDGTYQFYTIATDNAGNVETAPASADDSTVYDATSPVSSCTSDEYATSTPTEVDFTASDALSGIDAVALWYKYEDGSWTDSGLSETGTSGSFDFAAPDGDGTYCFQTVATDEAGNAEAGPSGDGDSCTMLDATPPVSVATAPSSSNELPISVGFASSDGGSGVSQTQLYYRFGSGAWQAFGDPATGTSGSFDFTAPNGEGTYSFYTIATDEAGNVEQAPAEPDATTVYSIPLPDIHLDCDSLGFGGVEVGERKTLSVLVTNVGGADLSITSLPCDLPEYEAKIVGESLPYTVAPDGSVYVSVTFEPSSATDFEGTLAIHSDDPDEVIVSVELTGTGVAVGELVMSISADAGTYQFGDEIGITLGVANGGPAATVDVYVVVAYDFAGAGQRLWSPVGYDSWAEGVQPWLTGVDLPGGLDISVPVWSLPVPKDVPNLAISGEYTLLTVAVEPGTFDFISEVAAAGFAIQGTPFILMAPAAGSYGPGDTLSIGLYAVLPSYSVTGDVYLATMAPSGTLWIPSGPGLAWAPGLAPFAPAVTLPPGFSLAIDGLWQIQVTVDSEPFNAFGGFYLLAAITETGTLTPSSDLGVGYFAIE